MGFQVAHLLLGSLVGHSADLCCNGCLIPKVVVTDGLQVLVKLVHQWNSWSDTRKAIVSEHKHTQQQSPALTSGNVEAHNVFLRHAIQVLHKGTQAVAMGSNEHLLASLDSWCNLTLPANRAEQTRNSVI